MGLVAGAIEEVGIRTVCLSTFEAIMLQVGPPRWLALPFPLGFPVGDPGNAEMQTRVLREAFRILEDDGPGPVRRDWKPDQE